MAASLTALLRRLIAPTPAAETTTQASALLEQLPEVVFRTDRAGRWRFLSAGWRTLTGFNVDASLGATVDSFLHPRDRDRWRAALEALLSATSAETNGVLRLLGADGEPRWLEVRARAATDADGRIAGVIGTLANVTTRVQEEELLQATHRTLRALIDEVPGMIYRCRNNPHWTMEYVSAGATELTGYRPEDLVDSRTVSYASLIHPQDQQQVWNDVQNAVRERQRFDLVYRIITRDGHEKWVWERGKAVSSASGELLGLEGFMTDITLAERRRRAQRSDALYDSLTRWPAEALFRDRLQCAVQRARRRPDDGYAVLQIRIDRFARLRARFGDDLMERVVLDVGRRLALALEPGDSLTRWSEDRFACLLERRCPVAELSALATRLHEQLRSPIAVGDSSLYVTASIGIAQSDTGYSEAEEVLRDADTAVNRAHSQGGGRHELFDMHLHARAAALHALERELGMALERGELTLVADTLADCADEAVHGQRATLAWRHPRRGLLMADDFLDTVNDEQLLEQLRSHLVMLAGTLAASAGTRECRLLCIDLPDRLLQAALVSRLAAGALATPPGLTLLLGLGEAGLTDLAGELAPLFARLGAQSPALLLTPFTFDSATLPALRQLPVQVVGIGPALYAGSDPDLARALAGLAHQLGLRVLATGVDHDLRLAQARSVHCDLYQGALAGTAVTVSTKPADNPAGQRR